MVRCSARALLGSATVLTALAVLPACGLISVIGVSGRVVDRETGQPIEGAVASLWRTAHCASFHAYSRHLPPAEARTDAAGQFSVGRGRTATTAGCLSMAWTRSLRILAPGYVVESFGQDDPWLNVDARSEFGLLKAPVALERVRYTLEAREEIEHFEWMANDRPVLPEKTGDPRPGPAWREAIAQLGSARVRTLDNVGVFVRRPGAIFDQIVVVDLLSDNRSRRRAVILARDRRSGTIQGFTQRGEPVSVPLPAPDWSLVGASSRLAVPALEKDSFLYHPAELDLAAPLNGLSEHQRWTRVTTRRGLRAVAALRNWWIVLEADGSAIIPYTVAEQPDRTAMSRLRPLLSEGPRLSVADVVPDGRPPIECVAPRNYNDLVIATRTAQGRGLFELSWEAMSKGQWRAEPMKVAPGALSSEVLACTVGGSAVYVSLRDQGIIRLPFWEREGDARTRARFAAISRAVLEGSSTGARDFTGLAAGTRAHPGAVYAVAGDDAIYRFSPNGEPDQRVELDVRAAGAAAPVR